MPQGNPNLRIPPKQASWTKTSHLLQGASPFPGNEGVESDRDSDAGQGEQLHPPSKSSPKVKETVAGRAEQRRTRKREKVIIGRLLLQGAVEYVQSLDPNILTQIAEN